MNYIEKLCKSRGYDSIRLDCFIENPYSRKLYDKAGYSVVGYADWRKGRFELREKKIQHLFFSILIFSKNYLKVNIKKIELRIC